MRIIDVHSRGGTCDRCGKGLVNVAVIDDDGVKRTVGLDCAMLATADDFSAQHDIKMEMLAARELGQLRSAIKKGTLNISQHENADGFCYEWQTGESRRDYHYTEPTVKTRLYRVTWELLDEQYKLQQKPVA